MTMDAKDTIATLNGLIETCENGVKGFQTAAEAVKGSEAKSVFVGRAKAIEQAEMALRAEVRLLGGDPEKGGTAAGAVHRGWIDLKSAITGGDDAAIITECERGEDVAVGHYESALKKSLPLDIRAIVDRQYQGLLQNRERVRQLKESIKSGKERTARSA